MADFDSIKNYLKNNPHAWLVTGAAGFIGSHLVDFLLACNQKVIGLDNLSTGYQKNLDEILNKCPNANFSFIEGDIGDLATCQQAVKQVDFVLHQAALSSVPRSIENPLLVNETNVQGFLNVLLAAKDTQVKRFVYASSSSVYGDSPILPKVESQVGNPLSPYAASKMADELYAKAFATCYDFSSIGLRYFNVFGPRQDPNGAYAAVIPRWLEGLLANTPVYINGDGSTSRDFCYVENVVQANIRAALTENPEALNTVYNVAVGQQTTLLQLYQLLKTLTGNTKHEPTYQDFRVGDIKHSLADISKATSLLGYQPEYTVQQGLTKTVEWYRYHVD